jgi:hypothetical protein
METLPSNILTIIESGGVVALAVIVWFELRGLRKDIVSAITVVADKQGKVIEQQATLLERQEHLSTQQARIDDSIHTVVKIVASDR